MISSIDHIGIAVESIEKTLPLYRDILGFSNIRIHDVPQQKVRIAVIPVGNANIELLEGIGPDSPITRFIQKRGEGIHHISLATNDIRSELSRVKSRGVQLINEEPSRRGNEYEIAFLHPSSTGKVLIELCQPLKKIQ